MYEVTVRLAALLAVLTLPSFGPAGEILYRSDFSKTGKMGWKFTDPLAWKIESTPQGAALALVEPSRYKPKVRSPYSIALLEAPEVGDFVLDLMVKSTTRDYAHRDLCLFFGYQDPEHFYYVHLGKRADPHAHSVFLVYNKPRVSIAKERTKGTDWTDEWTPVRLTRNLETGDIYVYFDNMKKPVMHAVDRTFGRGQIGVGSFDDTGMFKNIVLKRP